LAQDSLPAETTKVSPSNVSPSDVSPSTTAASNTPTITLEDARAKWEAIEADASIEQAIKEAIRPQFE
jgi:hypothetical protein